MHILKPRPHGVIDYAAILLIAAGPSLFGFGGTPATLCYALAGIYLALALFTAYPLGLVKVVPFTVHGIMELVLAPLLAALPWLARFSGDTAPRNFFIALAVALAGVWLVTDYKAADQDPASHGRPRRTHA
ncbi:MAG: hypothetical protein JWN48_1820 [Myxococcaceae bacterium]|nr:hypothetical protein [Myxococcaceae bacterium]